MKEKNNNHTFDTEGVETGFTPEDDGSSAIADETSSVSDESSSDSRGSLSLKEIIQENAHEEEKPSSSHFTLRQILGGDMLSTQQLRSQIWLILLIAIFVIVYVANRYSCQKSQLEINQLNKTLKATQYKALSISSELTEKCRESHVMSLLKSNSDSTIHPSDQPPYIINVK